MKDDVPNITAGDNDNHAPGTLPVLIQSPHSYLASVWWHFLVEYLLKEYLIIFIEIVLYQYLLEHIWW